MVEEDLQEVVVVEVIVMVLGGAAARAAVVHEVLEARRRWTCDSEDSEESPDPEDWCHNIQHCSVTVWGDPLCKMGPGTKNNLGQGNLHFS